MSHLLRRARWNAGLTPEALGEAIGISGMTIRRLEDGARPRPATAKKIADYFGVRPTDFWPAEPAVEQAEETVA